MKLLRATILGLTLLVAACGDSSSGGARSEAPARLVDGSHDALAAADFLRLVFVPASVQVTTLGGPRAVRVFAGASAYFSPPLPLGEVAAYFGVPDTPALDLVALRCAPPDSAAVDARFASWPVVFNTIRADLDGQYSCPPPSGAPPENSVYCVAAGYTDPALHVVPRGLANALLAGAGLLEDAATAEVMRVRYGIYPSFSGLGLTVAGSGDGRAFTAADSLAAAVSPEYLLRNVTLAAAGCRCIRVAPYDGRADDPLDPRFIDQRGGAGSCRSVSRLRRAS